jgi:hypothetical protein
MSKATDGSGGADGKVEDRVTLLRRDRSGDKVYQVEIVARGEAFVVNVTHGPRGGPFTKATKTPDLVPLAKARAASARVVDRLIGDDYNYAPASVMKAPKPPTTAGRKPAPARFTAPATAKRARVKNLKYGEDDEAWRSRIELPAFKPFNFGGRATGKCTLFFDVDGSGREHPAGAAVALANAIIAHQEQLAGNVAAGLWNDFTGDGPDSGMYWHGDLSAVIQGMESAFDLIPPTGVQDVARLLGLDAVRIRPSPRGGKTRGQDPLAELQFIAAFEDEHGLGVLTTDGRTVAGFGYAGDVSPFKRSKRRSRGR